MPIQFLAEEDFKEGALVVIDKPLGWTSFDVVNKIKYALKHKMGYKKIKVGHAGTLDPLATGVLVVCIGRMTKQIESLMSGEKEYTGSVVFGKVTPSFDLETEPEGDFPIDHLSKDYLNEATKNFLGEIIQYPPIFSAKKIDGKRAFKYAREGKEVKVRPNLVTVDRFDIMNYDDGKSEFHVQCSKGTYIRSLANDLGKAVDSGAYLSALRRVRSGEHHVDEAMTIEEVVEFITRKGEEQNTEAPKG